MASEEDSFDTITFKGTPVSELKVTDIKRELDKRGLSKSGSKTQLADRLKAQLLLEKLQQDAAQSSGDELEGKVPNMALQQDNKAGQSEFVRQYLEQQQRNLEIQMEVKKQVEEERKRKSADESSADESSTPQVGSQASDNPDVTSPKKFKDDSSNAPAKEISKMPRPARKSSRNASRGENGQEVEPAKERSRSPTPDNERLRERTRSGSSSSSRSPTPEKSRRGRSARGRAKRGGGRRTGRRRKESRSSSPSSSPEEVMPKKRQRRSTNSISSRSRSRSPQKVSPEVPTRKSGRRASSALKATPEHTEESQDLEGQKEEEEVDPENTAATTLKGRGRKKAPEVKVNEDMSSIAAETETTSKTEESLVKSDIIPSIEESAGKPNEDGQKQDIAPTDESDTVNSSKDDNASASRAESDLTAESADTKDREIKANDDKPEAKITSENSVEKSETEEKPSGRLSRWRSSRSRTSTSEKSDASGPPSAPVVSEPTGEKVETSPSNSQDLDADSNQHQDKNSKPSMVENPNEISSKEMIHSQISESSSTKTSQPDVEPQVAQLSETPCNKREMSNDEGTIVEAEKPDQGNISKESSNPESRSKRTRSNSSNSSSHSPDKRKRSRSRSSDSSSSQPRSRANSNSSGSSTDTTPVVMKSSAAVKAVKPRAERSRSPSPSPQRVAEAIKIKPDDASAVHDEKHKPYDDEKRESEPVSGRLDADKPPQEKAQGGKLAQSQEAQQVSGGGRQSGAKDTEAQDQSKELGPSGDTGDDSRVKKDKGAKKRKWGSKTSKATKTTKRTTSMEISSDSLKNLIGDVKLTETVFDMETEVVNTLDYDEHEEDRRDVKVKRTIVQSPQTEEPKAEVPEEDARKVEAREESPEPEGTAESEKKIIKVTTTEPKSTKTKVKDVKKVKEKKKKESATDKENTGAATTEPEKENKEKIFATTRPSKPLLPVVDEPEPVKGSQSPAYNPPSRVVRIAGLVRPFTVRQLKELLSRTGELDDEYFWISDIKSHCLAAYKSEEDAVKTRAALHGTRWPQSNPKILIVDFAAIEDVEHRKTAGDVPLPELRRIPVDQPKPKERKEDEEEREKRLKAREQRDKERDEKDKETRLKRDNRERDRRREPERKNSVREWDRDKIQQPSRSRSRSKDRERPSRRSRSRERDQNKRREHSKDKKDEDSRRKEKRQKENKVEEEPPAKLLDDLFRKTKATPCIYWLPLTEEQAQQRAIKRQEQEKERQKRLAAAEEREKEELKKREAARLERQRERERGRDRSRERDRERGRQERSRSSRSGSRSRSHRRR